MRGEEHTTGETASHRAKRECQPQGPCDAVAQASPFKYILLFSRFQALSTQNLGT